MLKHPVTPDDEAGRQTGKTCDLAFGYGGGFGSIVPSDAAKESWFALKENRKTKLQGSRPSGCEILQSQIGQNPKNRLTFSRLAIVHARLLIICEMKYSVQCDVQTAVLHKEEMKRFRGSR